ncbi:MAG: DUF2851 family protein [Chloroflexota bacterium]
MFVEKVLVEAWQNPRLRQLKLATVTGQELRIVYPGSYRQAGPDFRGAALLLGGKAVHGDVEIDLDSRNWQRHGHHRAPAFDQVVLQVVYWAKAAPYHRTRGGEVAVLSLGAFFTWEEMRGWARSPCRQVKLAEVEAWGEARFRAKAEAYRQELAHEVPDQVLFRGLLVALGYARNQWPMAELARRFFWPDLVKMMEALPQDEAQVWLSSLLLAQAQVLPWQVGGIRPLNHPWRRLEAASHLLVRYRPELVDGIRKLLAGAKAIEQGLLVPRLLGPGRVGEVAVNVLLPIFWALGDARVWELFKTYPQLEENEVSRMMRRRLELRGKATSACGQQGLIHHYKVFCEPGRCQECLADVN